MLTSHQLQDSKQEETEGKEQHNENEKEEREKIKTTQKEKGKKDKEKKQFPEYLSKSSPEMKGENLFVPDINVTYIAFPETVSISRRSSSKMHGSKKKSNSTSVINHSISRISSGSRDENVFFMKDQDEIGKETSQSILQYLQQFPWSDNGKQFVKCLIQVAIDCTQKKTKITKIKEQGINLFQSHLHLIQYLSENELNSILHFIEQSSTFSDSEKKEKNSQPQHQLDFVLRYFCAKSNMLGVFKDEHGFYTSKSSIMQIQKTMQSIIESSQQWREEHDTRMHEANFAIMNLKIDESVKYILTKLVETGAFIEIKSEAHLVDECKKLKDRIEHFSFRAAHDFAMVFKSITHLSVDHNVLVQSLSYLKTTVFSEERGDLFSKKRMVHEELEKWNRLACFEYQLNRFLKKKSLSIIGKIIIKQLLKIGAMEHLSIFERQQKALKYLKAQSVRLKTLCEKEKNSDIMIHIHTSILDLMQVNESKFTLNYIRALAVNAEGKILEFSRDTPFYHEFYDVLPILIDDFDEPSRTKKQSDDQTKLMVQLAEEIQAPPSFIHLIVQLDTPLCDGTRWLRMTIPANMNFSTLQTNIQLQKGNLFFAGKKWEGLDQVIKVNDSVMSQTIQSQFGSCIERNTLKLKLHSEFKESIASDWVHISPTSTSTTSSNSTSVTAQWIHQQQDVILWNDFSIPFQHYVSQSLHWNKKSESDKEKNWNGMDINMQRKILNQFTIYQNIRDELFENWMDFGESYDETQIQIQNAKRYFKHRWPYLKNKLMMLDEALIDCLMQEFQQWTNCNPLQENFQHASGCLTYLCAVLDDKTGEILQYSPQTKVCQLVWSALTQCKEELAAATNAPSSSSSCTLLLTNSNS